MLFLVYTCVIIVTCVSINGDLHAQMLCANVDTSGESDCTCDGCVCDADLVAFKKTCRTEVSMTCTPHFMMKYCT